MNKMWHKSAKLTDKFPTFDSKVPSRLYHGGKKHLQPHKVPEHYYGNMKQYYFV